MPGDPAFHTALRQALARLLRPLARLMLRHAVPYDAFESVARRVFVEVAMADFPLPGRKPSISRASILTGLTRKDVQGLLDAPAEDAGDDGRDDARHYNRAARVLSAWGREAAFRDDHGTPRPLRMDGADGFTALVRRHSGDMPVRAILDELLRLGAVQLLADGRVALRERGFVPYAGALHKLGILGNDVGDLIRTIDHNLEHGQVDPRYQRKVMYDAIPVDAVPAFRALGGARSQRLLEQFDAWLAERDLDRAPPTGADAPAIAAAEPPRAAVRPPTARVGIGIYYFEETNDRP